MQQECYCVIMAGGVGSRFWPLSKTETPKQFLDILGTGKTLIQQTYERFSDVCKKENFIIVTSTEYIELVEKQLPDLNRDQILAEPYRRNTAPCIAYANAYIKSRCENANIIVTPADHLILKQEEFIKEIKKGLDFISNNNSLLTIGIMPHKPETGYGYIQIENATDTEIGSIVPVKTFTEKPNLELAKVFYESGEFYWNSGIFLWTLDTINEAFNKHLPEIKDLFDEIDKEDLNDDNKTKINSVYGDCKSISIDYGVIERAKNIHILTADIGWTDLGTWSSLYEHSDKDNNQNAVNTGKVLTYDTEGCIINLPSNKKAVIQGLNDFIIAEADNCLLICKRDKEQKIRTYSIDIENEFDE